jgi:hypothetical protein
LRRRWSQRADINTKRLFRPILAHAATASARVP